MIFHALILNVPEGMVHMGCSNCPASSTRRGPPLLGTGPGGHAAHLMLGLLRDVPMPGPFGRHLWADEVQPSHGFGQIWGAGLGANVNWRLLQNNDELRHLKYLQIRSNTVGFTVWDVHDFSRLCVYGCFLCGFPMVLGNGPVLPWDFAMFQGRQRFTTAAHGARLCASTALCLAAASPGSADSLRREARESLAGARCSGQVQFFLGRAVRHKYCGTKISRVGQGFCDMLRFMLLYFASSYRPNMGLFWLVWYRIAGMICIYSLGACSKYWRYLHENGGCTSPCSELRTMHPSNCVTLAVATAQQIVCCQPPGHNRLTKRDKTT